MIAPHELKNKSFSRVVRGYNPVEVDSYFDFLIEKYTEAYKSAIDLEQKLNKIQAKYSELANEEESIRSAILKAQKLGEAIVNNAENEAVEKEAELRRRCDQIVEASKKKVLEEKENIVRLRKMALDFQHNLYCEYMKHVEMIQNMNMDEMLDAEKEDESESFECAKSDVLDGGDFSVLTDKCEAETDICEK